MKRIPGKRIPGFATLLLSALFGLAAAPALAADNPAAGANSPRPSAGQPGSQQTPQPGAGPSTGVTPRTHPPRTRPTPSDDGGYGNDATVHRTGQRKRTNADGSDFVTGQDDGPDNTTYPGD